MPHVEHLTAKHYVDQVYSNSVDEPTMVRKNQDKDFNNHNLTCIKSNNLNTQAVKNNQVITKSYVDLFDQESERSRRDVTLDFLKRIK